MLLEELNQGLKLKLMFNKQLKDNSQVKILYLSSEKIILLFGVVRLILKIFNKQVIDIFAQKDKENKILRKELYLEKIKILLRT